MYPGPTVYTVSLHHDDAGAEAELATMEVPGYFGEAFILSLGVALAGVTDGPLGYFARVTRSDSTVVTSDLTTTPPVFE